MATYQALAQCNPALWNHVYHPDRFTVWKRCKTVTGVILDAKRKEADGDYHIHLKLDPGQPRLLNQKNMNRQKGCLVLEIICVNPVTQDDAIGPCKHCPHSVIIPKTGDHVKVTGSFVLDNQGGHGWNEIHPVFKLEIL